MRSGFTIVKNGVSLDYPFCEAILSLLPFVDELIVAHGDSTDATKEVLLGLKKDNPKIIVIDSPWDPTNRKNGSELARQTNIALEACRYNLCFYIQSDEVLCDLDRSVLEQDLIRFEEDEDVDALLLQWVHFYGNYSTIVESKKWYRREIRVIKRDRNLKSHGDAQGFRIFEKNRWIKPRAALSRARMFHYGWVKSAKEMTYKTKTLDTLWHQDGRGPVRKEEEILKGQYGLKNFCGTHPKVMKPRIDMKQNLVNPKRESAFASFNNLRLFVSDIFQRISRGYRIGEFNNYRSLKKYF